MVQQRIQQLQAVDANITTVDIPELVLRNLTAQLSEDEAGVALVYLGKDRGLIVLTRQSTLYLARTLDLGYADIYRANEDLALGEGTYERLVLEVQRSLDYYDRYFMQPPISTVLLAPLEQEVPALLDYVEQSIGVRSRMLDLNEIFPQSSLDRATQCHCLLAISAAMRRETTKL
jgi:MSHA biogenesis protein MshI